MTFKPYPRYKASGVEWLGEVPIDWLATPIKHFGRLKGGAGFPHDEQGIVDAEVTFHKVNALAQARDDGSLIRSENAISKATAAKLGAYIFPPRSIVFAKVGAALLLGRIRVLREEACIDNNMMGLEVDQTKHDVAFTMYAMSLVRFDLIANPGAVPSLNEGQIGNFTLLAPSRSEQASIATFLDRETTKIDTLIAKQEAMIELLKEKRQAVISHAVTKGLDSNVPMKASGVEWLGDVPEHWRPVRLNVLYRQEKRQNFPELAVLSVYRDYGVIRKDSRQDNMNKTPDDLSLYQLVKKNDLVVNKMKAWQGSLGVSDFDGITSPDYIVFSPNHSEDCSFLHLLLRCRRFVSVYRSISNGIRPAQWRLEPKSFLNLTVFLPPLLEQQDIVASVGVHSNRYDTLTAKAQQAIALQKERRTALISAAVTGKIDVRGEAEERKAA